MNDKQRAFVEAISLYFQRPNTTRREIGMSMIRDGVLSRKEEDRLLAVLEERRERRGRLRALTP